jgi:hypothetical protein
VFEESRYILWNEEVREKEIIIWHSNCLARERTECPDGGDFSAIQ